MDICDSVSGNPEMKCLKIYPVVVGYTCGLDLGSFQEMIGQGAVPGAVRGQAAQWRGDPYIGLHSAPGQSAHSGLLEYPGYPVYTQHAMCCKRGVLNVKADLDSASQLRSEWREGLGRRKG